MKKSKEKQSPKKEKKQLSYKNTGKYIKGFLCMVTYMAFVVSFVFTVYGTMLFGPEIITSFESDYFQTDTYQEDISTQATNLLYNIGNVAYADTNFSVTYVEDGICEEYNGEMAYDFGIGSWEHFGQNEEAYLIESTKSVSSTFYGISSLEQYLNSKNVENNYIYYSDEAFQKLFIDTGLKNTNQRFSENFSEHSYFVFECSEEKKKSLSKMKDNAEKIVENMVYAVYDPVNKQYYSVEDDYFNPMEAYIYDATELSFNLEELEKDSATVVFLLLRSSNLIHEDFWGMISVNYEFVTEEKMRLEAMEDSSFVYYFKSPSFKRGNVDSEFSLLDNEYAYKIQNGELSFIGANQYNMLLEEDYVEEILQAYAYCPQDAVFYFGIDTSAMTITDHSDMIDNILRYELYSKGSKITIVVAVLAFILLIMQAACMIQMTGKESPDDTKIQLNKYDQLPTEIWAVINVLILFVTLPFYITISSNGTLYNYLSITFGTLPFGFFFMIIVLSVVRRIKAHNLWKGSLCYWLICKITGKTNGHEMDHESVPKGKLALMLEKCKEQITRIKGTNKLFLMFVLYMIASVILGSLAIECGGGEPYVIFMFIQAVALLIVTWIIKDINKLIQGIDEIKKGNLDYKVSINERVSIFREMADGINHIGDGLKSAVETSIKDERMKTELITNVSHDLKTPLTSIINYINLLKKVDMPNNDAKHYIEVLDTKSQRLKQLTEDLVEAAKATSGNIELEMMPITFDELMKQALGEFEDKFETRKLTVIATYPGEPAVIIADGRRLYRIIENVLQNVYKYALEGTRVYVDLAKQEGMVIFTLKNISASPLNISPEELMERFTRGDSSRTTEGSGLGLSIAKDLTRLQSGKFEIQLDGDLFKVIIQFPQYDSSDNHKLYT